MIVPARRLPWIIAILAAGSFALYVARASPILLYDRAPALLEASASLIAGILAGFVLLALIFLLNRRTGLSPGSWALLLALPVVLFFPFAEPVWTYAVLAAVGFAGFCAITNRATFHNAPCAGDLSNGSGRVSSRWFSIGTLAPLLAGAFSLAVYLRTMAPSVVAGDSAEFQAAGYTLGIAHPTGYPLYLLIARLFAFLPLGTAAYRVNLVSGVFAAATVILLACAAQRLADDWRAALVAALAFAFTGIFWSQAVIAEVYSLNTFFIALMLLLIVRGLKAVRADAPVSTLGKDFTPFALFLVLGLSLANHRTALLMIPTIFAYALLRGRRRLFHPAPILLALSLVLLPLALYLYLPLRWPAVNGEALTWERFQWYVFADGYRSVLRPDALLAEPDRYSYFLRVILEQFNLPILALGGLGILILALRQRRALLLTMLAFATFVLFPVAYHVPDAAVFSVPGLLIIALWLASSLAALFRYIERLTPCRGLGLVHLGVGLAGMAPALLLVSNFVANDASHDLALDRWGRTALQQELQPGAVVVADMLRMSALRYFYSVESPESRVEPVMPDDEPTAARIVSDSLSAGRPTYLARYVPGLETKYHLSAPGPLVLVTREAPDVPLASVSRLVTLTGGVVLSGFTPASTNVAAGDNWNITLFWRLPQKVSESYLVHLRLVDPDGRTVASPAPSVPVQGLYPTWAWRAGELVADYHEFPVPLDLPSGHYQVEVGLGGAFRQPDRWAPLQTIDISPPAERPLVSALHLFDQSLALVGYDWTGLLRPGGTARLIIAWQPLVATVPTSLRIHGELLDDLNAPLAMLDAPVSLPDGIAAGQRALASYELEIPSNVPPGTYRFRVRLESGAGRLLPALSGWLGSRQSSVPLANVMIAAAPDGALTNLGNKAILVRHVLEREDLRPGDDLRITLFWKPATKIESDYTVFVHLLDGQPRVRAQVDSYPGAGLRPTSQWRPDELVPDSYQIPIPDDLPPGEYQVEVGMYFAPTMQRLRVLDGNGQPVDDRVIVGAVRVR